MSLVLLALGCSSSLLPSPLSLPEPGPGPEPDPEPSVLPDAPPGDTGVDTGVALLVLEPEEPLADDVRVDTQLQIVPPSARDGEKGGTTLEVRAAVELRGKSSTIFPKRSFNLELRDAEGRDLPLALLGMPPEADWVVHAPYSDKTALRNALTYELARGMGRWAPRARFTEVRISGEYVGLYVVFERPELDSARVDLPEPTNEDPGAGGYLFKLEGGTDGGEGWTSDEGVIYEFQDPSADEITDAQRETLIAGIDAFEDGIEDGDHPAAWIDVPSFTDFVILQELSRNVDGYRRSTYLQRLPNTRNGLVRAGPVWDFDIAWGNADFCDGWNTEGLVWEAQDVCEDWHQIPDWWITILRDPRFQDPLRCRWEELRGGILADDAIHALVTTLASPLEEARARDEERWGTLGVHVWPNAYVGETWEDELAWLRSWALERADWLDDNLPGVCPG